MYLSFLPNSTLFSFFIGEETEVQSGPSPNVTPRKWKRQISNSDQPDSKPHADSPVVSASWLQMLEARQRYFDF